MNFDAFIKSGNEVTVLFYAEWYRPSMDQKRYLESTISSDLLLCIDVDTSIELTDRFKIKAVPTMIKFSEGEVTFRSI
jgi:thioredoxin-like negative regulator of GroEL